MQQLQAKTTHNSHTQTHENSRIKRKLFQARHLLTQLPRTLEMFTT